jgi:excisionase family DNA binding protein
MPGNSPFTEKIKVMSSTIEVTKVCNYCKQEFIAKTIKTRYCSHSCNNKDYKNRKRQEKIKAVTQEAIPEINETEPNFLTMLARMIDGSNQSRNESLNIEEACILLGVTSLTLRRWIKNGVVKSIKVGKRHIIKRREIDRLMS